MTIYRATDGYSTSGGGAAVTVSLRCPGCRHQGTFDHLGAGDVVLPGNVFWLGQRRCPNPDCRAHIFFVYDVQQQRTVNSYPPERIDFDSTDVPAPVLKALEEAIACHATGCFVAAALMVRKTLEELCRDRGAEGNNLKARVQSLQTKVVLPKELFNGLDDLRLLGNDAAHVESREYDNVGKEEVEVGVAFTKEVLKAVYQYSALLASLKALKKSS